MYCIDTQLNRYSLWNAGDEGNVAHEAILNSGVPYMGWSWFGNGGSSLDMVVSPDNPNVLSPWGKVFVAAVQSGGGATVIPAAQSAEADAPTPLDEEAESPDAEAPAPEVAEDPLPTPSAPLPAASANPPSAPPAPAPKDDVTDGEEDGGRSTAASPSKGGYLAAWLAHRATQNI